VQQKAVSRVNVLQASYRLSLHALKFIIIIVLFRRRLSYLCLKIVYLSSYFKMTTKYFVGNISNFNRKYSYTDSIVRKFFSIVFILSVSI